MSPAPAWRQTTDGDVTGSSAGDKTFIQGTTLLPIGFYS